MSEQFPHESWDAPETNTPDTNALGTSGSDSSGSGAPEPGVGNDSCAIDADQRDMAVQPGNVPLGDAVRRADSDPVPVTGLDSVDRVLAKHAAVSELPINERAAAYQELHTELETILDQQPGFLPAELTGRSG